MRRLLTYLLALILLWGCHRGERVDFDHLEEMIAASPEKAVSMLDSIDRTALSEADRHHVDLLSIKARQGVCHAHLRLAHPRCH